MVSQASDGIGGSRLRRECRKGLVRQRRRCVPDPLFRVGARLRRALNDDPPKRAHRRELGVPLEMPVAVRGAGLGGATAAPLRLERVCRAGRRSD